MTVPRQAKQSSGRGPRMYGWPPTPPHEFEAISVTSAIRGGLPKPQLEGWAAKVTAEAEVDDHKIVAAMLEKGDERAAIDHLKGARYRDMGKKADRGTIVHAALESYLSGKELDIKEELKERRVPTKLWSSTEKMFASLLQFFQDEEPEVIWSEATVFSRTHGYAGTTDLIARMLVGDERLPVVLDVKTSKAIYDDTALQLVGYARADFVGLDNGTEVPLLATRNNANPVLGESIEYGVVVRPHTRGYEKAVFALTNELFELFLACLAVTTHSSVLETARRP